MGSLLLVFVLIEIGLQKLTGGTEAWMMPYYFFMDIVVPFTPILFILCPQHTKYTCSAFLFMSASSGEFKFLEHAIGLTTLGPQKAFGIVDFIAALRNGFVSPHESAYYIAQNPWSFQRVANKDFGYTPNGVLLNEFKTWAFQDAVGVLTQKDYYPLNIVKKGSDDVGVDYMCYFSEVGGIFYYNKPIIYLDQSTDEIFKGDAAILARLREISELENQIAAASHVVSFKVEERPGESILNQQEVPVAVMCPSNYKTMALAAQAIPIFQLILQLTKVRLTRLLICMAKLERKTTLNCVTSS